MKAWEAGMDFKSIQQVIKSWKNILRFRNSIRSWQEFLRIRTFYEKSYNKYSKNLLWNINEIVAILFVVCIPKEKKIFSQCIKKTTTENTKCFVPSSLKTSSSVRKKLRWAFVSDNASTARSKTLLHMTDVDGIAACAATNWKRHHVDARTL